MHTLADIEAYIAGILADPQVNRLSPDDDEPAWGPPLIGVSDGDDPLYEEIRQDIGPFHWTPRKIFSLAFPEQSVPPGGLSVIVWALPQTRATLTDQRKETSLPSRRWAKNRRYGEEINRLIRTRLAAALTAAGHPAVAPVASPLWRLETSARRGEASRWSERHAAWVSGLGTFGLCDGLITEALAHPHHVGLVAPVFCVDIDHVPLVAGVRVGPCGAHLGGDAEISGDGGVPDFPPEDVHPGRIREDQPFSDLFAADIDVAGRGVVFDDPVHLRGPGRHDPLPAADHQVDGVLAPEAGEKGGGKGGIVLLERPKDRAEVLFKVDPGLDAGEERRAACKEPSVQQDLKDAICCIAKCLGVDVVHDQFSGEAIKKGYLRERGPASRVRRGRLPGRGRRR